MTDKTIRLGTRGSLLARTQSGWVLKCLEKSNPGITIEMVIIKTTGDVYMGKIEPGKIDKGLFTKEIETALLDGTIDLAVHSLKDLPTELPAGLTTGAIPERESPFDAVIGADPATGQNITVGTSSLRRKSQLKMLYPNCNITDLRGNLDTRIRKVREGELDTAIVAAAGLARIDRSGEAARTLTASEMLPAPGQGALALETRAGDSNTLDIVSRIHCANTAECVNAERAFLQALGGGCQIPIAALAVIENNILTLSGRVLSLDGKRLVEGTVEGPADKGIETGTKLAEDLIAQGASEILREICGHEETGNSNE